MMTSSVVFIGTGADSLVTGPQVRGCSGLVLSMAGNQFVIDPGPGTMAKCRMNRVNVRETVGVFATHGHLGHAGDVNAILMAMSYNGLDKSGVLIATKSVVEGTSEVSPLVTEFHRGCVEKFLLVEPGKKIALNEVDIEVVGARHPSDATAVGLRFTAGSLSFSYTGDTELTHEVISGHANSTVLVANCPSPFDHEREGSLNANAVVELLKQTRPRVCVITHFGSEMLKADPIVVAREIRRQSGIPVIAAQDGQKLDLAEFARPLTRV